MKTTFAAVAVLASFAYAQLDAIPSCALTCLTDAIQGDGCSGLTDFECHCSKSSLVSQVTPCVDKACSESDIEDTITAVEKLCADAGVPITIPAAGASTTAAATSAAASSAAASSAAPVTSEAAASSAPAVVSSAPVLTSFASGTGVASTGGVTYPGANSTVSSAPIPTFSGGAAAHIGGSFLAAAGALVVAAL